MSSSRKLSLDQMNSSSTKHIGIHFENKTIHNEYIISLFVVYLKLICDHLVYCNQSRTAPVFLNPVAVVHHVWAARKVRS